MSTGLVKAKKYDWKDSNLALFGSDTEKLVKKDAATKEPAWHGAGQQVGLKIWRIVKFKVTDWPQEDYGKFFSGDSYIILNTFKPNPESEELAYDLHFWIGSNSTQDEYATAAYKTVELDTFLDDKPVQHREVQDHESENFLSYFPHGITIMEGGAESGFNRVQPEQYKPRLLHFCGVRRNIVVKEVPLAKDKVKSGDVYILDLGTTLYQWNGSGSNKDERFKAMQYLNTMKSERGKVTAEVVEQASIASDHPFYEALTAASVSDDEDHPDAAGMKQLYRVSDAAGKLNFGLVKEGVINRTDLDSSDVFVLDVGNECFVWIGNGASASEKQNGLGYAHNHLMKTGHPLVPIVVIKEGQKNSDFNMALAA